MSTLVLAHRMAQAVSKGSTQIVFPPGVMCLLLIRCYEYFETTWLEYWARSITIILGLSPSSGRVRECSVCEVFSFLHETAQVSGTLCTMFLSSEHSAWCQYALCSTQYSIRIEYYVTASSWLLYLQSIVLFPKTIKTLSSTIKTLPSSSVFTS